MEYEIINGILRPLPIGYRMSDDGYDSTLICIYDMKHYSSLCYYHRVYKWETINFTNRDMHFDDMPSSEQGWFPHIIMTKELKKVGFYGL